jgi:hypothetical protein
MRSYTSYQLAAISLRVADGSDGLHRPASLARLSRDAPNRDRTDIPHFLRRDLREVGS